MLSTNWFGNVCFVCLFFFLRLSLIVTKLLVSFSWWIWFAISRFRHIYIYIFMILRWLYINFYKVLSRKWRQPNSRGGKQKMLFTNWFGNPCMELQPTYFLEVIAPRGKLKRCQQSFAKANGNSLAIRRLCLTINHRACRYLWRPIWEVNGFPFLISFVIKRVTSYPFNLYLNNLKQFKVQL